MIEELRKLPEVSFIDGITLEDVQTTLVHLFEQRFEETNGQPLQLRRGDPRTRFLYACGEYIFHCLEFVDRAGKQDLLKYAYGEYLDHMGSFWGLTRNPASCAETTIRFTLSEARPFVVSIPEGIRVTPGNNLYFATTEYAEVPAGDTFVDVPARCITPGEEGNHYEPGAVKQIVDPLPFVDKAANIDETAGGAGIEDDEQLRVRIFLAPASYSTAGPEDAYKFHTLDYSAAIGSCNVSSPKPGDVVVRVLMKDSSLPSETLCQEIWEHLSDKTIRPLTDRVFVQPPDLAPYDLDLTYWIGRSRSDQVGTIREAVTRAIDEYNAWQQEEIGRDVNPDELILRVMNAGAKRVEIQSPAYTVVPESSVARLGQLSVTYGGIEQD